MNDELLLHTIKVDEYISVDMKIPRELDALSLKGLMLKANRLLNLSEVAIPVATPKTRNKVNGFWTEEKRVAFKKELKAAKTNQLAFASFGKKHGIADTTARNEFYARRKFYKG